MLAISGLVLFNDYSFDLYIQLIINLLINWEYYLIYLFNLIKS